MHMPWMRRVSVGTPTCIQGGDTKEQPLARESNMLPAVNDFAMRNLSRERLEEYDTACETISAHLEDKPAEERVAAFEALSLKDLGQHLRCCFPTCR